MQALGVRLPNQSNTTMAISASHSIARLVSAQDLHKTLEIPCHLPVDSEIGLLEAVHLPPFHFALVFVDG
jgi:hypothetical protein